MAEKKQAGQKLWAVYQGSTGSITLGGARFVPLAVIPVEPAVAGLACPDSTPVRFFESPQLAEAEAERLRAQFARAAG